MGAGIPCAPDGIRFRQQNHSHGLPDRLPPGRPGPDVWALYQQPLSSLLRQFAPGESWSLPEDMEPEQQPAGWWCLRLDLDRTAAGNQDWTLQEEKPDTYKLQWIAADHILRLIRHGEGPRLLASVQLPEMPARVLWKRHEDLHEVLVGNHRVLRCLDLLARPAGRTWSLRTQGDLGRSRVYLLNQRHLRPPEVSPDELASRWPADEKGHIARAHQICRILRARLLAMMYDDGSLTDHRVLARIEGDLVLLENDPQLLLQARAWCNWVLISSEIRSADFDAFALSKSFYDFRDRSRQKTDDGPLLLPPQTAGILLDFVERLTERVGSLPRSGLPVPEMVRNRQETLNLIDASCNIILSIDRSGPDRNRQVLIREEKFDLLLIRHAARMLAGFDPEPTPTGRPPWVVDRWRMLAGSLPINLPLDDLPFSPAHPPVSRTALKRLLDIAHLHAAETARMRARILSALANDQLPERLPEILTDDIPERERLATRLILVAAGETPVDAFLELLKQTPSARDQLKTDPLLYALARLAAKRRDRPSLSPAADLQIDFASLPASIPPEEGIAAALAMREVTKGESDWSLLESIPSCKLPLRLLVP